jgi:hypothetical protein
MEWIDDPWIEFACDEMMEEFIKNHGATMPEDPLNVWKESEIGYFCFSFTLWAAEAKFKLKRGSSFSERVSEYRANVKVGMKDSEESNYSVYEQREAEYISLLKKGTRSIWGTISGSPFKQACRAFVGNACKRYIFSEKDLVKIISPWLIEKGMSFDRKVGFSQ